MNLASSRLSDEPRAFAVQVRPRVLTYLTLAVLIGIAVLGAALRTGYVSEHGSDPGWNSIVLSYTSLALSIKHGDGYFSDVSGELETAASIANEIMPISEYSRFAKGEPTRPTPYLTPGYPYLTAAIWAFTGDESHRSAQYFQAIFNGLVGTLCVFVILNAAGHPVAGLMAALGYAVARPLMVSTTYFLPDAYTTSVLLIPAALLAAGFQYRRPLAASIAAGFILGLAVWLRAEAVALMPLFLIALIALSGGAWKLRARCGAAFVAFWLIPLIGMGLFTQNAYGEFHLTRPGAGVRLWEGIGQQPNPWGIRNPPGQSLDAAAGNLLRANGLDYGTWTGDGFLLRRALDHMTERPEWFVRPTAERFQRVVTLTGPSGTDDAYFRMAISVAGEEATLAIFVPLSIAGAYLLRRKPLILAIIASLWLSTALPFSFFLDEIRNTVSIAPAYIMLSSIALYHLVVAFFASGYQLIVDASRRWQRLPQPVLLLPAMVLSLGVVYWWATVAYDVLQTTSA